MVRTRFAPSPTGYMHIGNLRTALYEFLIAKANQGIFVLRIEDTDMERFVEGATEIIMKTLETTGLIPDEGPGIGGDYGPYVQSERKDIYIKYAKELVAQGNAYYCFCTKERLDSLKTEAGGEVIAKYDRHCLNLSQEEIDKNLESGMPYVIRQKMPREGSTTFSDLVYGDVTVDNAELDDQIIIKSDGFPTYNFCNVIDDHLMDITHVVRGSEYLSSAPKYNLLYEAFGWDIPVYVHCPPVMKDANNKLSKRKGDPSFEDLVAMGYLPEALLNFIALLGWSPSDNQEFFNLQELIAAFDVKGLSKSPSIFDMQKLKWMNSEYIKRMDLDAFYELTQERFRAAITTEGVDLKKVAALVKTRLETLNEIPEFVDFIDALPEYGNELYVHKKMKTTEENSLENLEKCLPFLEAMEPWSEENLHEKLFDFIKSLEIKNGQMLWPIRTALSGKPVSFGGAIELMDILGKEESLRRIKSAIAQLKGA